MATSQDNHGIEAYFTPAEFQQFSEYEKLRLRNMKQNYEMMIQVGLNVPPPDFMRPSNRKQTKVSSFDTDGDGKDANRKPGKSKSSHKKTFKVPLKKPGRQERQAKKPAATVSRPPMYDSDDAFEQLADITIGASDDDNVYTDVTHENTKEQQTDTGSNRRYSLRQGTRKSYKDLEAEDDDIYVYCEDCHELYEDDCPSHPLTTVEDKPVPPKCKNRAKLSLPPGLLVKEAGIEGAGKGIWAQKFFPKGVRFGPYGGEIVMNERMGRESGYSWEIFHDKKRVHYINGKNKTKANWMRYVNCARNESEQNLIAYQYRGQIYYRSFKPIYPGKELLVYYGEEYAKELGIEEEKFTNDGVSHPCALCPGVAFTSRLFFLKHLKYRHHQHVDLTMYQSRSSPHIGRSLCKVISASRQDGQGNRRVHVRAAIHDNSHDPTSTENGREEETAYGKTNSVQTAASNSVAGQNGACASENERVQCKRHGEEAKNEPRRQKRARNSGDISHQCKICGKEFSGNANLIKHMRVHTGERPYQCSECGKGFNQKGNFDRHIRIQHQGSKNHICGYCQRTFSRKDCLKQHVRIHTGEKPYKCKTCGMGFAQQGHLVNHERTHSGMKPFQCTQCNKTFKRQFVLIQHLRVHTGERPYKCHVCGKGFAQIGSLTIHMRSHTGGKPFKCSTCGKEFAQNSNLNRHKKKCYTMTT